MSGYVPSPTAERFHADDDSLIRVLMSAVGTGKTVALLHELFFRACDQEPNADGVRQTRWLVARASYSQLKSTTMRTFIEWFGQFAKIVYDSPIRATINLNLPDGTTVETEFLFMSLDGDDAMDQLLSFEITGGAVNEVAEVRSKQIFKRMLQRCARFPSMKEGVRCTWHGVIADMNPPPIGSWLYDMFEVDRLPRVSLFKYPPPIFINRDESDPDDVSKIEYLPNPEAENWQNLSKGYDYWIDMARVNINDWDYITCYVLGDYPYGGTGRPVYPMFSHTRHVSPEATTSFGSLLLIGMDFGFKPAAIFCQYHNGRLHLVDEIVTEDSSLTEFLEDELLPKLRTEYASFRHLVLGDPSGDDGTSTIDRATSYQTLRKYGLSVKKPRTNKFKPRRDAVVKLLNRRDGVVVNPRCTTFIGGAASGYCWKETRGNTSQLKPDKTNIYSHIHDAFQCVALYLESGGETYTQLGLNHDSFEYREAPEQRVSNYLYL